MIVKKKVSKFGTSGHVIIHPEHIGEEVYVVTKESVRELEELVTITLLYRKAQQFEQSQMVQQIKDVEARFEARLIRLEKIMFSQ